MFHNMRLLKVIVPFERNWMATCSRYWDRFEHDGKTYTIQTIPPEDDERALQVLVEHLCPDEMLCSVSGLVQDQESVDSLKALWRDCLSQRVSLGLYTEVDGDKSLVALNVCAVDSIKDRFPKTPINGKVWKNVFYAMDFVEARCNTFQYLNVDVLLHGYGVVVKREFRGAKFGGKLLMARRPLALAHGIKATSAVFTVPASQLLAARTGFKTIQTATLREIAEAGWQFPKTDHVIKLMVQKYSEN